MKKEFNYRGKKYLLSRDSHCFSLSKIGCNEKQEETFQPICYAGNLEHIIIHLFNVHVLDDAERKSLLQCIKDTKNELKELFSNE